MPSSPDRSPARRDRRSRPVAPGHRPAPAGRPRARIPLSVVPGTATFRRRGEHPVLAGRTSPELDAPRCSTSNPRPGRSHIVTGMSPASILVLGIAFGLAVGVLFAVLIRAAVDRGAAVLDLQTDSLPDGAI